MSPRAPARGPAERPAAPAGKRPAKRPAAPRGGTPPARAAARRAPPPRQRARVARIWELLEELYPEAECELDFETPFQLGVATILSAQCTDVRVNKVTPELFRRFPDAASMAAATQEEVEALVRTTGFFRNKAKNILGFSRQIMDRHGGEVPRTMEALLKLPGVARKTANCILSNAYGLSQGVVVDTHVLRLSRLLGLSAARTPEKVEEDLCWRFTRDTWPLLSHRLIWHGRRVCIANRPRCDECPLRPYCPGARRD